MVYFFCIYEEKEKEKKKHGLGVNYSESVHRLESHRHKGDMNWQNEKEPIKIWQEV